MFLQHLLTGITIGCSYALIALGYTLVYGVLKLINFAHGEIYMIGAYLGYILVSIIPSLPFLQSNLIVCLLAGVLFSGCHEAAPDEAVTETAVVVKVEPVTVGSIREEISATKGR